MKFMSGLFYQVGFPVVFAVFFSLSLMFYQSKDLNKMLFFAFFAWVFIGLAGVTFTKKYAFLEKKFEGVIYPSNQERPRTDLTADIPKNAYLLLLGNSVAWSEKLPMNIFRIKKESVISIKLADGNLLLSANFIDKSNKIIAELKDNVWRINENNYYRKERPNKSQLIIYDQYNKEILKLFFMNPKTIKITGIFHHKSLRNPLVIAEDHIILRNIRLSGSSFGNIGKAAIQID